METILEITCNICNKKTKININQNFYFCENNCTNTIFSISSLPENQQQHIKFVRSAINNMNVREKLGLADKE
jgi:hypothetical protein